MFLLGRRASGNGEGAHTETGTAKPRGGGEWGARGAAASWPICRPGPRSGVLCSVLLITEIRNYLRRMRALHDFAQGWKDASTRQVERKPMEQEAVPDEKKKKR